jgi:hypothetical protein
VTDDSPGIGKLESKEARLNRIAAETSKALAVELWEERGRPAGGAAQFLEEAQETISAILGGKVGNVLPLGEGARE